MPPKDGSEVSTASYQSDAKAKCKMQISLQEIHSRMGSAGLYKVKMVVDSLVCLWRLETTDDGVPSCGTLRNVVL